MALAPVGCPSKDAPTTPLTHRGSAPWGRRQQYRGKLGRRRPAHASSSAPGGIMLWGVMASDKRSAPITADEQSAFEEDAVRLGLTAAGMGEYVWDLTRDVFVVSPRMSRITGLPVGSMPADDGAAIYRFIHPDDQDAVRTAVQAGRDTRQRYKARHRVIRPD